MKNCLHLPLSIWTILLFLGFTALGSLDTDLILPGSCIMQPCIHGVCTDIPTGGHRCFCQNGYTGLSCQTNYNDCRSEPCLNGGSCIDGIDEFTCVCDLGYTGSICETDINECSSDPCLNGGICEDLVNDYLCHCALGYFGINCELYFNVCATENEFCKNEGMCVLGPGNTSSCSCQPNYYGEKCELSSCPCVRGGICVGETDFNCLCPFGFTGKTCETALDVCDRSKCNGGLCLLDPSQNVSDETICFCVPDFHGRFCEEQYNECFPESACQNGATCVDDIDGFSCVCPAGFVGSMCNESCVGEDCQSTNYEPPAILPSYSIIYTSTKINISPAFVGFHSTPLQPSGSNSYQIYSSQVILPEQSYTTSGSASYSFHDQNPSPSPPATEKSQVAMDTAINLTQTSVTLPFNPVHPTPSLEPFSSTKTNFLPDQFFKDIHSQNESVNLSDFSPSIQTSELPRKLSTAIYSSPSTSHRSDQGSSWNSHKHEGNHNIHSSSIFKSVPVYPSDSANDAQFKVCKGFHCQNGGTPAFSESGVEGKNKQCQCLCPLLFTGPNCERETYLLIPQFHKSSFLKHVLPPIEPEKGLDIDISFKILSPDGIIFFTEAANSGAFLMLHVEHGLLKLRFSCGQQTTVFMGTHDFVNNNYFTTASISVSWTPDIAQIRNASCNVELLINGSAPMSGQQFLLYPQFHFHNIFIGGVPLQYETSIPEIHKIPWFEGCVISLQVNGEERELVQDAEVGVGITECYSSACYRNPCLNGATCRSYDDHWNCECAEGYAGPFCEHKTCFANPCEYGSTCLPNIDYGYLCICPYGKHGKNCELDLVISVPSFYGNIMGYASYIQYQLFADYHYHLEIRLMFSTTDLRQKSLLIFNGQIDSSYLVYDFLAVSLHAGYVISMFNLGSGTRILKSTSALSRTLAVHSVLVGRHRRYCWMEVDSQPKVVGLASGQLTALNTPSALYIGGHSSYNFSLLPEELKNFKGFIGCTFGIEFRTSPEAVFHPMNSVVDGRNIQQCTVTECELIHCANGGTCIDVGSTFQCNCAEGWSGTLCHQKSTPCTTGNHRCHSVSTCVPLEDGYRCNCPLGRSGKYCEKNITVSDPLFDGASSYLSTRMVNVRHSMDVILSIKPLSSEGLIFYAAQHLNELSRDFISLSLTSGYVQLRFNLGTDPSSTVILNTFKKVENNSWQIVEFGRYKRVAYLKLEEDEEVTSISPPGMEILDIGTSFYLGGVPDLSSLPKQAFETVPTYYKGCIRLFSVNAKNIELYSYDNSVMGLNIEDCDGTACGFSSCKNGGVCIPEENGFFCQCPPAFHGDTCETPIQCVKHNCLHGSSCIPVGKRGHKCVCPIGWRGENCEIGLSVTSAFFSGSSFFSYKDVTYRHWNLTKTNLSFKYLNNETSGLLMWTGKVYSEEGDYLGIGLSNNRLHVVWSLGWLSRNEIITDAVDSTDSMWHHVQIERNGKTLSLHIDDKHYSSSTPGNFYELNTDGNYYFGGFPSELDIEDETLGYFYSSFIGCMKDFTISGKIINIMEIKEGRNLESCTHE